VNYTTRDPQPINRDPVQRNAVLSRDFVVRSILKMLDNAQARREWGSVTIQFQAGAFKTIRKEETITEEK
jgi:hypothetical protein